MIRFCPRCGAKNAGREPVCACGQKLYGLLAGRLEAHALGAFGFGAGQQ